MENKVVKYCYCCCENQIKQDKNFCEICFQVLLSIFKSNAVGIEEFPEHVDHCILCGEWENRRIIWTGNTGAFDHEGSGIPICEKCILDESEE